MGRKILLFLFLTLSLAKIYSQTPRDSILDCIRRLEKKLEYNYLERLEEIEDYLLSKGYLKSADRKGYGELFKSFLIDSINYFRLYKDLSENLFKPIDYYLSVQIITTCYTLTPYVISQYDKTGSAVLCHLNLYHFYDYYEIYQLNRDNILRLLVIMTPYKDDFLRHNLLFVFLELLYEKYGENAEK